MTAFSIEDAQTLLERQERRLVARGHSLATARAAIARGLGVAPGTLENLRRGRMKEGRGFRGFCSDLKHFLTAEIKAEMGRLSHELALVDEGGRGLDPIALRKAENLLAEAAALLGEGRGR